MTTPGLAAHGDGPVQLRARLESLCTPLPDGTLLVYAPINGSEPLGLYLLPDAKTKDRYLWWATAYIKLGFIFAAGVMVPLLFSFWIVILNSLTLNGATDTAILIIVFAIFLWFLVPCLALIHLCSILFNTRHEAAKIWLRQDEFMRRAEEWRVIYLSCLQASNFIATLIVGGLMLVLTTLPLMMIFDACGGGAIFGGTFLEVRPSTSDCSTTFREYLFIPVLVALFFSTIIIFERRKLKATRAKLPPNPE